MARVAAEGRHFEVQPPPWTGGESPERLRREKRWVFETVPGLGTVFFGGKWMVFFGGERNFLLRRFSRGEIIPSSKPERRDCSLSQIEAPFL